MPTPKKLETLRRYYLTGDILHAGTVTVDATSLDEAIEKAEKGEFEVDDEQGTTLGFILDSDNEMTLGEEIGGQIIIYTNRREVNGKAVPFDPDEEEN